MIQTKLNELNISKVLTKTYCRWVRKQYDVTQKESEINHWAQKKCPLQNKHLHKT